MRKDDKNGLNGLTHVFVAMGAIAFFVAGVPILDSIGSWVSNVFGLKCVKLNHEASQYTDDDCCEDNHAQVVGFQIPSEAEEVYEDE